MQPQNEKGWMKDSEEIREKRDKDAKKEQCGDTKQRRTKKKIKGKLCGKRFTTRERQLQKDEALEAEMKKWSLP